MLRIRPVHRETSRALAPLADNAEARAQIAELAAAMRKGLRGVSPEGTEMRILRESDHAFRRSNNEDRIRGVCSDY